MPLPAGLHEYILYLLEWIGLQFASTVVGWVLSYSFDEASFIIQLILEIFCCLIVEAPSSETSAAESQPGTSGEENAEEEVPKPKRWSSRE